MNKSKNLMEKSMRKLSPSKDTHKKRESDFLNEFAFEEKFENPEKLNNFRKIKYEELIKDLEKSYQGLSKAISATYFDVFI